MPYNGGQTGDDAEKQQPFAEELPRADNGVQGTLDHQIGIVGAAAGAAVELGLLKEDQVGVPPQHQQEEESHHQDPGEEQPGEQPAEPRLPVLSGLGFRYPGRGVGV